MPRALKPTEVVDLAPEEQILFDPQTSGGLLPSVPTEEADDLTRALEAAGVAVAAQVAEVVEGPPALEIG